MFIRDARLSDVSAIAIVHVDTWLSTYRGVVPDQHLDGLSYERAERATRSRLSEPEDGAFTLVAELEKEGVVGFAAAGPAREPEAATTGEVYAVYVLARHQGQGIGRVLMQHAVKRLAAAGMRSMIVWVLKDNPARGFYARLGGSPKGTQRVTIGGCELKEIAYSWDDTSMMLAEES